MGQGTSRVAVQAARQQKRGAGSGSRRLAGFTRGSTSTSTGSTGSSSSSSSTGGGTGGSSGGSGSKALQPTHLCGPVAVHDVGHRLDAEDGGAVQVGRPGHRRRLHLLLLGRRGGQ